MSDLKDQILSDLKAAMLSGDKPRVEALKMLKTAISYKEVELGARETGLTKEQIIDVLIKEAKKRTDAAKMYEDAGRAEQAAAENFEKEVITTYLPAQASEEDIQAVIDEVVAGMTDVSAAQMGQIIGQVKTRLGQSADGATIARLVKSKIG